jgi:hypothetical protein
VDYSLMNDRQEKYTPLSPRRVVPMFFIGTCTIVAMTVSTMGPVWAEGLAANPTDSTAAPAPGNDRLAQARLSDINGNWAEPFIRGLAEKGILAGYPDGTYRPDNTMTRAEFAAVLNKAFPELQPTRPGTTFRDVRSNYWASQVIQRAYRSGFMAGFPNGTFGPQQNLVRIQALTSFMNGFRLTSEKNPNLAEFFSDSADVPGYGRDPLMAATERCVAVSVNYPNGKVFGPNVAATRADVAAILYQTLVATGKVPKIDAASGAQRYIAGCNNSNIAFETAPEPTPTPSAVVTPTGPSAEEVIGNLSLPEGKIPQAAARQNVGTAPVSGVNTPSAFGLNFGDVVIGGGYQDRTRAAFGSSALGRNDGAIGIGFGLGDARSFVGLETLYASTSTARRGFFEAGNFSFKLHKLISDDWSIAAGIDNYVRYGVTDASSSTGYGVTTKVFNFGTDSFPQNITASVGVGSGRFRTYTQQTQGPNDAIGVFGSLGMRLSQNFAVVGDYDGQSLAVGLPISIALSDNMGLQVTPAIVDITNNIPGGSRFVIGGGLGFRF